ncbi:MAG: hypothetical protein U1E65_26190 [Myxococcota bacterium]
MAAVVGSSSEAAELDITPAPGVAVVMVTPRGKQPGMRATDLSAAVRAALQRSSRLRVEPGERWGVDPAVLGDCPQEARFLCWIRASTSDPELAYLLVVSVFLVAPGELRVTSYWFDLGSARRVLSGGGAEAELDSAIFQTAVAPEPARVAAEGAALQRQFERLADALERGLPDRARPGSFGEIALELSRGSSVELDGHALGELGPGPHRLRAVEPGPHRLVFVPAGQEARTAQVIVAANQTASLTPDLEPERPGTPVWFVVGGLGLAAGGATLLALGAGEYAGRACAVGQAGCDPSPARALRCEVLGTPCPPDHGALFLSLGTGFLTAAVGAMVGAIFFEDQAPPWWSLLAGAALGGAATAIAASAL